MILLLFLTAIILLLCFTPKEGYADKNTFAATSSINKLKGKLEKMKNSIEAISNVDVGTNEISANLRGVLNTDKDKLYKNGVVNYVQNVTDKLSELQTDSDQIVFLLDSLKKYNVLITNYIQKLEGIKKLLDNIPES